MASSPENGSVTIYREISTRSLDPQTFSEQCWSELVYKFRNIFYNGLPKIRDHILYTRNRWQSAQNVCWQFENQIPGSSVTGMRFILKNKLKLNSWWKSYCNLCLIFQVFYGGESVSVNPKINNMHPGYKAAQYEYILISDSGIRSKIF